MKKQINGQLIDMTAEEISARQAEEAHKILTAEKKIRSDAKTTKTNKEASGKAKLKELGLDDAEIKALIGV